MLLFYPGNLEKSSEFSSSLKEFNWLRLPNADQKPATNPSPPAALDPDNCISSESGFSHSSIWKNCGCAMAN